MIFYRLYRPAVLSWPSFNLFPVPVVLPSFSVIAVVFWPSCILYLLSLILTDQVGRPVLTDLSRCPVPVALSRLSCPCCNLLAILSSLPCHGCPCLFCMSCPSCDVQQSCPQLSCPHCRVLALLF
jgi:hypothetical protein